jgi:hypothetical protein
LYQQEQGIESLQSERPGFSASPQCPGLGVEHEFAEAVQVVGQAGHNPVFRGFENF